MTAAHRVWTFFYGSFMNADVLAKADVHPAERQAARLDGWALAIAPHATLVPAPGSRVFGVLGKLTHEELDRLYMKDWFGFGRYLPEAVVALDAAGGPVPALCYVAWESEGGRPTAEYVERILQVAREYSFPEDYVRHIRSFL